MIRHFSLSVASFALLCALAPVSASAVEAVTAPTPDLPLARESASITNATTSVRGNIVTYSFTLTNDGTIPTTVRYGLAFNPKPKKEGDPSSPIYTSYATRSAKLLPGKSESVSEQIPAPVFLRGDYLLYANATLINTGRTMGFSYAGKTSFLGENLISFSGCTSIKATTASTSSLPGQSNGGVECTITSTAKGAMAVTVEGILHDTVGFPGNQIGQPQAKLIPLSFGKATKVKLEFDTSTLNPGPYVYRINVWSSTHAPLTPTKVVPVRIEGAYVRFTDLSALVGPDGLLYVGLATFGSQASTTAIFIATAGDKVCGTATMAYSQKGDYTVPVKECTPTTVTTRITDRKGVMLGEKTVEVSPSPFQKNRGISLQKLALISIAILLLMIASYLVAKRRKVSGTVAMLFLAVFLGWGALFSTPNSTSAWEIPDWPWSGFFWYDNFFGEDTTPDVMVSVAYTTDKATYAPGENIKLTATFDVWDVSSALDPGNYTLNNLSLLNGPPELSGQITIANIGSPPVITQTFPALLDDLSLPGPGQYHQKPFLHIRAAVDRGLNCPGLKSLCENIYHQQAPIGEVIITIANPPAIPPPPACLNGYEWVGTKYLGSNTGGIHNSVRCSTPTPSDGTPKDTYCDSAGEVGGIVSCCDSGADCFQYTCQVSANPLCTAVVNGVCNNAVINSCNPGSTLSDDPDNATDYLWSCLQNPWQAPNQRDWCSKPKVIGGSCNNSVVNGCLSGKSANPTTDANFDYWICTQDPWQAPWQSDSCSKAKVSVCGDTQCTGMEWCGSCPGDCGACGGYPHLVICENNCSSGILLSESGGLGWGGKILNMNEGDSPKNFRLCMQDNGTLFPTASCKASDGLIDVTASAPALVQDNYPGGYMDNAVTLTGTPLGVVTPRATGGVVRGEIIKAHDDFFVGLASCTNSELAGWDICPRVKVRVNPVVNTAPNPPTVTDAPTDNFLVNSSQDFIITGNGDNEGDDLYFEIDWSEPADGVSDGRTPVATVVASNGTAFTAHTWVTTGPHTFKVRAVDDGVPVMRSNPWTTHAVTIVANPIISVTPPPAPAIPTQSGLMVDIGTVYIGNPAPSDEQIVVTNVGPVGSFLTGTVSLSGNPRFTCASGCTYTNLASGASQTALIHYDPNSPIATPGSADLTTATFSGAQPMTRLIQAHPESPPIIIVPTPLQFGTVTVINNKSKTLTLSIKNDSPLGSPNFSGGIFLMPTFAGPLTANPYRCVGATGGHYAAGTCNFNNIPPQTTVTYTITFLPTVVGTYNGFACLSPLYCGVGNLQAELRGVGAPPEFKVIEK